MQHVPFPILLLGLWQQGRTPPVHRIPHHPDHLLASLSLYLYLSFVIELHCAATVFRFLELYCAWVWRCALSGLSFSEASSFPVPKTPCLLGMPVWGMYGQGGFRTYVHLSLHISLYLSMVVYCTVPSFH